MTLNAAQDTNGAKSRKAGRREGAVADRRLPEARPTQRERMSNSNAGGQGGSHRTRSKPKASAGGIGMEVG